MVSNSSNCYDLDPERRAAAEKLLGRSLTDFRHVMVQADDGTTDIIVRLIQEKPASWEVPMPTGWKVPACFQVLTDLTDAEQADFNAVMAEPIKLSQSP